MTVEVATFPSQLDPTLPASTDPRSEGDNHLRLLKSVLQNTFPNLTRAVYFDREAVTKVADYTILASDGGRLFIFNPSVAKLTATLPALGAADAGWFVKVMRGNSNAFPLMTSAGASFIVRAGAAGLSVVRTNVVSFVYTFTWNGTNWNGTRANSLPIGSLIDFAGSALPTGYEWPNGQVFASALDYPDYNSLMGGLTTLDLRGRTSIASDTLGIGAAGRVGAIIAGTLGSTGGSETVTLNTTQIPSHIHANTLNDLGHDHSIDVGPSGAGTSQVTQGAPGVGATVTGPVNSNTTGISINNVAAGGGLAHSNLQASIIVNKILVVE